MLGRLFLVATPIGNLSEFSPRGVEVLKNCHIIACEDTRRTRKLLSHFSIPVSRLVSFHEHNEREQTEKLLGELRQGRSVALVSDAGMPVLSDPGYRLVRAAAEAGVPVSPVSGPSAVISALAASGLPPLPFTFFGFLPSRGGPRRSAIEALRLRTETLVLFEAPHHVIDTLRDVLAILGDRHLCLAREISKIHEEFLRGSVSEILAEMESRKPGIQGEITLVLEGAPEGAAAPSQAPGDPSPEAQMQRLLAEGLSRREASKQVAARWGIPAAQAYKMGM